MLGCCRVPTTEADGQQGGDPLRLRDSSVVVRTLLCSCRTLYVCILKRFTATKPQCRLDFVIMCSVVWRLLCRSMNHGYLLFYFILLLLNLLQVNPLFGRFFTNKTLSLADGQFLHAIVKFVECI